MLVVFARLRIIGLFGGTYLIQDIESFCRVGVVKEFGKVACARGKPSFHEKLDQTDIGIVQAFKSESF